MTHRQLLAVGVMLLVFGIVTFVMTRGDHVGDRPLGDSITSPSATSSASATSRANDTATRSVIASKRNATAMEVVVGDARGRAVAGARVAQVRLGRADERMVPSLAVTTTDSSGLASFPLESTSAFPKYISITAEGYLPHVLSVLDVGPHHVALTEGYDLSISVTHTDGTGLSNCAVMVSSSPLPRLRDALTWLDSATSIGEPVNPKTRVQLLRTSANGFALARGLAKGAVFVQTVGIGLLERRFDPFALVVPETRAVSIVIDRIYALALKTPGDKPTKAGLTHYDSEKVDLIIGEQMHMVRDFGHNMIGEGICIPLVKSEKITEHEFLQLTLEATAVMERRGQFKFSGRPMTLDSIANAPKWDDANTQDIAMAEVEILASDNEQERVLRAMEGGLVELQRVGAQDLLGFPTVLGLGSNRVPAGRYRATGKRGVLDKQLVVPREVHVLPGQKFTVAVALREPLMPVKVRIVDSSGVDLGQARFRITVESKSFSVGGFRNGVNRDMVFWIPAGHVVVTASTAGDQHGREEFDCRGDWTTIPTEVLVIIGS